MATARIFKMRNSYAVGLPKELRLRSKEVEIFRRGDEVVLREKFKGMERAFWLLADLPIDVAAMEKARKLPTPRSQGRRNRINPRSI